MPSIRDFSGGVVNQYMLNRDNGNGVLYDMKNVLSSYAGELRKRTGTKYIASLDNESKIIPYRDSDGNDIVLVFGVGYLRAFTYAGNGTLTPFYVFSGESPEIPTSSWTSDTNGDWSVGFDSQASSTAYNAFNIPEQTRGMKYYGKGGQYFYPQEARSTPAYVTIHNSSEAVTLSDLRVRWCNTCNGNRPAHYKAWVEPVLQYSDDGETWTSVQTDFMNPLPFGGSEDYRASYVYGLGDTQKTENYVFYKVVNVNHKGAHSYWRVYFASRIINTQTYDGERLELLLSDINFFASDSTPYVEETDYTEEDLDNIRWAQNDTLMILTAKGKHPKQLVYQGGNFTFSDFIPSSTTNIWESNGKPSCVAFYAGRLWFAGFESFPTRAMASAFGNFQDFTIPQTIQTTSPIIADGTRIKHIIENMFGAEKALYLLSEDGVSMIDAPDGTIVSTSMIEMQLRNSEPVNSMIPTVKDDIMIYLGRNRTKILITDFDFVVQRFKAQNISKYYDDFLKDQVAELHYIPNKASLIYGSTASGSWFAMLFDTAEQKNAIFPFETDGKVYDIQPIKYESQTRLVMVVQRNGVWFLEEKIDQADQERMDFMSDAEKQVYTEEVVDSEKGYLDCMVISNNDTPVTKVPFLPYLSGGKIDVIADGVYLGTKTLGVSSSTDLFAWDFNGKKVYTYSQTPTINDLVVDENGAIIEGINISSADGSSITIHSTEIDAVRYYGWSNVASINVTPTGSHTPVTTGIYNRYSAADTPSLTAVRGKYGWNNGSYTRWTATPNPIVNDSVYNHNTTSPYREGEVGYINAISGSKVLTKTSSPSAGDEVFDTSYSLLGQISSGSATSIVYNGATLYRDITLDITISESVEHYDVYYRDSSADIGEGGVYLSLDNPAKTIIMGYPYESYAVIKFATPYAQKKYPKQIACYFINTAYLELGNSFETMSPVVGNLDESFSIDGNYELLNGEYVKTLEKQIDEKPYVIVRSDKGLPFTITGLDYNIDYSNYQGGV